MAFENGGDLIAAQQRIMYLEALVESLRLEIEVLKSHNTMLQDSLSKSEKSRLVQKFTKQAGIAACASEDKLNTLEETPPIASSAIFSIDIVSEAKKEAQTTSEIKQAWSEEGEQVIHLMSEIFQTHETTKSKIKKGDLSHYARRHVALKISYVGARFHGFASDASMQRTVESELFRALEKTKLVTGGRLEAHYTRCGRTDKGVSANGQVVALLLRSCHKHPNLVHLSNETDRVAAAISSRADEFHFSQIRGDEELDYVGVLNRALPPDIRIMGWCYVPYNFHARFSCLSREYNYFFLNDGLDIEAMKRAARKFCGEHDFRNFCRMDADNVHNFRREIMAFDTLPCMDMGIGFQLWMFRVKGTAFLWHQVRCMVAVLLMVGQKKESECVVDDLLDIKKTPRKPQYVMAPESPLVLQSCNFEGLSFYCSPSSVRLLQEHRKTLMNEHLAAVAMLEQLNLQLPTLDDLEHSKTKTCKKLSHVPLSCRPTEPTFSERRAKLLNKRWSFLKP